MTISNSVFGAIVLNHTIQVSMLFFVLVNLLFSCSVISREEIKHNGNGKEVIEFRQQHSWAKIQTKTVNV